MSLFGFLRCLLLSHEPNRRRVRSHGDDTYTGRCRFCGASIKRLRRDKWARDWGRRVARNAGVAQEEHFEESAIPDQPPIATERRRRRRKRHDS